jgi:hypothetical protein
MYGIGFPRYAGAVHQYIQTVPVFPNDFFSPLNIFLQGIISREQEMIACRKLPEYGFQFFRLDIIYTHIISFFRKPDGGGPSNTGRGTGN